MNENVQRPDDGGVRSARRRLLRGTFAVPTVMTLQSGSALAATSTLRCFRNMPQGAAPVHTPDNVWRVHRFKAKVGGSGVFVYSGSEIKGIEGESAGKLLPSRFERGQWYMVDRSLWRQVKIDVNDRVPPERDGVLLALRMLGSSDESAPRFKIIGVALDGSDWGDARIMTRSCWGSVF